jgi:hypothetical protein
MDLMDGKGCGFWMTCKVSWVSEHGCFGQDGSVLIRVFARRLVVFDSGHTKHRYNSKVFYFLFDNWGRGF